MSDFSALIQSSDKFQNIKSRCIDATKLSLTGITNLIVNHEDPCIVDSFLSDTFKSKELYHGTIEIDAVELQQGNAGQGYAISYIDQLIYGTFELAEDSDEMDVKYKVDSRTGERKRKPDGFINRPDVLTNTTNQKLLIIRNIDYSNDFCSGDSGVIDSKALYIFDKFRNSHSRHGLRLLLITNEPLKLPFSTRSVEFEPVDEYEATHLLTSFIHLCKAGQKNIDITKAQREQIQRKIFGLTYTEAGDVIAESLSDSKVGDDIDSTKVVKFIRDKVNRNFMQDGNGLSHIIARPCEDYICPKASNFTWDVQKILRDFDEIKVINSAIAKCKDDKKIEQYEKIIRAIRTRMPHVILLYGKGGVGKSAFAPHFAGLLEFDAWNFNVAAAHSKYIGEGAERMRKTLDRVSSSSHLVCRIDEYDRAMGSGGNDESGMHEAHRQVESELMNWLQDEQEDNNFVKRDIFLVITTNHKDNITGPLLRSGRIDLVIDIDDFDEESTKEAFLTAPRRLKNREVLLVGFNDNYDKIEKAINRLDLPQIAKIANQKGFTVRDVDMLLQEMAAHAYYHKRGKDGLEWTTDNFVKVLEKSIGSVRENGTAEFVLGDRLLTGTEDNEEQTSFDFLSGTADFDIEDFKKVDFFK